MSWPSPSVAVTSLRGMLMAGTPQIPSEFSQVLLVINRLSVLTGAVATVCCCSTTDILWFFTDFSLCTCTSMQCTESSAQEKLPYSHQENVWFLLHLFYFAPDTLVVFALQSIFMYSTNILGYADCNFLLILISPLECCAFTSGFCL